MEGVRKYNKPSKQLRARSLGTKITDTEYALCEKSAARRGQTLSEWCRQVLLEAVSGPALAQEAVLILSEVLALRKIMINLSYDHAAGGHLSERRMRELIEAADSEKLRKAAECLRALRAAEPEVLSDGKHGKSISEPPGDGAPSGGMAER